MRKTLTIALTTALGISSLGLSGCFLDGRRGLFGREEPAPETDDGTWDDPAPTTYGTLDVTWTQLDGQLGGHALALADVTGTATGDWGTTLEVETTQGGTWALFRLSLDEDLYADGLADGTVMSTTTGEYVDLMGCTGPSPGNFDYDGYAERVDVAVFEGAVAGTREVEITATFVEGGVERQVLATVVLDLADAAEDPAPSGDYVYAEHATTWTEVTSDLGPTDAYALSTIEGSAWSDGYGSAIDLDTMASGRWVMFSLSLDTDLDDVEPGETVQGDLLGCVGPSRGTYDFDGHTDAQLQVYEGDGPYERIGRLTATFETEWGPQTVEATVRYEVF